MVSLIEPWSQEGFWGFIHRVGWGSRQYPVLTSDREPGTGLLTWRMF